MNLIKFSLNTVLLIFLFNYVHGSENSDDNIIEKLRKSPLINAVSSTFLTNKHDCPLPHGVLTINDTNFEDSLINLEQKTQNKVTELEIITQNINYSTYIPYMELLKSFTVVWSLSNSNMKEDELESIFDFFKDNKVIEKFCIHNVEGSINFFSPFFNILRGYSHSLNSDTFLNLNDLMSDEKLKLFNLNDIKTIAIRLPKITKPIISSPLPLRSLNVSHNNLTVTSIGNLCLFLEESFSLAELNLSHNDLGNEGIFKLALSLKNNTGLKVLDLSSNKITSTGCRFLSIIFEVNKSFQHVRLDSNYISFKGYKLIKDSLAYNDTIELLNISNNKINEVARIFLWSQHPRFTVTLINDDSKFKNDFSNLNLNNTPYAQQYSI